MNSEVTARSMTFLRWLNRQREHYFLTVATDEEFDAEIKRVKALRSSDHGRFPFEERSDAGMRADIDRWETEIDAAVRKADRPQLGWQNHDSVSVKYGSTRYTYFRRDGYWPGDRTALSDEEMTRLFIAGRVVLLSRRGMPFPDETARVFRQIAARYRDNQR